MKYTVEITSAKTIRYYKHNTDILHRLDGPAVEYGDGDKFYYVEGKRHRLDGPAIEHTNGDKYYYVEGKKLSEEEFKALTAKKTSCVGKVVEVDGVRYKLVEA